MKRIVSILGLSVILIRFSCTEIESYGIYSIHITGFYHKDLLVIKGENTASYCFDTSIKLDLKTLINYDAFLVDELNA